MPKGGGVEAGRCFSPKAQCELSAGKVCSCLAAQMPEMDVGKLQMLQISRLRK